ncbi:MAG: extracellular solute-binding protein [Oscillospiraceae bacterium]|nr:extracellular solute-binding protein [Oscillospiraceae bacterium]
MKRFFAFLAAILSLALFWASCGGSNDASGPSNEPAANNKENDDDDEAPEAATERLKAEVPDDMDYGGYEFKILCNSLDITHWGSRDIYVEGENGDTINDAVYYRNRAIEEKYNITVKGVFSTSQLNDAKKNIKAGDDAYDVLTIPLQGSASQLAQEGMLLDLKNVAYIDLEKPWWDQKANEQLSIGGKLMTTIGDLLVIDKDALFIFLFNKDIIREYGLEDPYQLVRDGKWTIDKMWDMARGISKDIDGDGAMDDSDCYGFISQTHTMHGNVVGSGHFVIVKDKDDMPVLNISDPMIQASYEKWISIYNDRQNTIVAQDYSSKYADIWDYQLQMLAEKRGLYLYTGMNRVTLLRETDCNFGILPNPKYDEAQGEYYNAVHAWCTTSVSIPITSDSERTGIVLEALTAESYYTLRPAYYDTSLKTKLMRDDESGEMLDLIFSNRCYDLGHVYNWGGIFDIFGSLTEKKSTDFVSAYEKILPKVDRDMEKAISDFSDFG